MFFHQVIGQDRVKSVLLSSANMDRMPHAQLFVGPSGSGKLALAMAYAQYILCENKTASDSCGKCTACIKAHKLIHPDVHYSYPTIGSKMVSTSFVKEWRSAVTENPYMNVQQWLQRLGAENKQGNITKDECVDIVKKLSLKIFEASHKILIMWLPEYLGKEGNRLLKLIEEPPENTIFLLVAERQELILNTILSRCQLVKINPLQDEEVEHTLIEQHQVEEDKAMNIARLANGDLNKAIELIDQSESDNAQLFLKWFRVCYKGNGEEMINWVGDFAKRGRENQKHFFQYALHFLREFLFLKVSNKAEQLRLQGNEKSTALNMTKVLEVNHVEQLMGLFNEVTFYIERNANAKILMLDTSIQVHKIIRNK